MLKIKPLLLFIIASIALHWWVLSLPIFQRIKLLEKTGSTNNTPTIFAKLSNIQVPLEQQKMNEAKTSTKAIENAEMSNQQLTAPPPPILRGSPWSRRPVENLRGNPTGSPSPPIFTQVEIRLQNEFVTDQTLNFQCTGSGLERVYLCQGSSYTSLNNKMANILNQLAEFLMPTLPSCMILEAKEKKWHAKACHS